LKTSFRMLPQVKAALFDAVGTVLRPRPEVADVYHDIGRRCGSRRSREEVRARFDAAFARQEKLDGGVWSGHSVTGSGMGGTPQSMDAMGVSGAVHALRVPAQSVPPAVTGSGSRSDPSTLGRTDEAREVARWRQIVADVFDDRSDTTRLFQLLWEHFADPAHWALFDDVAAVCGRLRDRGLTLGLASNFDARLEAICRGHLPLISRDHVFYSSRVGWRKPFQEFFAAIQATLGLPVDEVLMVGDSLENDYLPALSAGWHAVLLRREGELPGNVRCVRGLAELLDLA
jgi:putative hydrolase of the HAD superfamily